jgi:DNA-directed RNA polymerase subunit RPC12/RpoP
MAKPSAICPACEHQVELTTVTPGVYKCSNCWHIIDQATVDKMVKLASELAQADIDRKAIFTKYL